MSGEEETKHSSSPLDGHSARLPRCVGSKEIENVYGPASLVRILDVSEGGLPKRRLQRTHYVPGETAVERKRRRAAIPIKSSAYASIARLDREAEPVIQAVAQLQMPEDILFTRAVGEVPSEEEEVMEKRPTTGASWASLGRTRPLTPAQRRKTIRVPRTDVDLEGWEADDVHAMRLIRSHAKGLARLSFAHCNKLTESGIRAALGSGAFERLQYLSLAYCYDGVVGKALMYVAIGCPMLEELDVSGCSELKDEELRPLSLRATRLCRFRARDLPLLTDIGCHILHDRPKRTSAPWQVLDVSGCEKVTAVGIVALMADADELVELGMARLPRVTELAALGSRCVRLQKIDLSELTVGDEFLAWIAAGARGTLRECFLRDCRVVTEHGLTALTDECPGIEVLDLTRAYTLQASGLDCLMGLGGGGRLRELKLDGLGDLKDPHIANLPSLAPNLQLLHLNGLGQLTDRGVCPVIARLPELRDIAFAPDVKAGSAELYRVPKLSDRLLHTLATHAPKLKRLIIPGMRRITDEGIAALASGCPNLQDLNVAHCSALTDACLCILAEHHTPIRRIVLSGITGLTDKGIAPFAAQATFLDSLFLIRCHRITDASLFALTKGAPRLREIHLTEGGLGITDAGLTSLAKGAKSLEVVNVIACDSVTDAGLWAFATAPCVTLHTFRADHCVGVTPAGLRAASALLPLASPSEKSFGLAPSFRGASLRARVNALRERALTERAVIAMQCHFRGRLTRWYTKMLRKSIEEAEWELRIAAATAIQAMVRMWFVRVVYVEKRDRRKNAVARIVRFFRMIVARSKARDYMEDVRRQKLREFHAAIHVQRVARACIAKARARRARMRFYRNRLVPKLERARARVHGAYVIGKAWKLYQGRVAVWNYFLENRNAALTIQRAWRGSRSRRVITILLYARSFLAVRLQAAYRGWKGRKRAWLARRELCRRMEAASELQRIFRGWGGRKAAERIALGIQRDRLRERARLEALSEARMEEARLREVSARAIQRVWFGHKGRAQARLMRAEAMFAIRQMLGAVKMQRAFRHYVLRKALRERRQAALRLFLSGGGIHRAEHRREMHRLNGAAEVIERWWHGRVARSQAATRIQAAWRGRRFLRWFTRWRRGRLACIVVIQRFYRRSVRLRFLRMVGHAVLERHRARRHAVETAAAELVQAHWRASREKLETKAVLEAEIALLRHEARTQRMVRSELDREAERRLEKAAVQRAELQREIHKKRRKVLQSHMGPSEDALEEMGMMAEVGRHQRRILGVDAVEDLKLTVGELEKAAMVRAQRDRVATGERPYHMIYLDLSAPLADVETAKRSLEIRRLALEASLRSSGFDDSQVAERVRIWEKSLNPSTAARAVHLWVLRVHTGRPLMDLRLHVVPKLQPREDRYADRRRAAERGEEAFFHRGELTRLELYARRNGDYVLSDLSVGPVDRESPEATTLLEKGMRPLGMDLSEAGLASGLQLWAATTAVKLPEDPESRRRRAAIRELDNWSPLLQRVVEMLQLTAPQVGEWQKVFEEMDVDHSGTVSVREWLHFCNLPYTRFNRFFFDFFELEDPSQTESRRRRRAAAAFEAVEGGEGKAAVAALLRSTGGRRIEAKKGGEVVRAEKGAGAGRSDEGDEGGGEVGDSAVEERIRKRKERYAAAEDDDDSMSFGQWAWAVAVLCLWSSAELKRFVFSFIDTDGVMGVTPAAMKLAIRDLVQSAPGTPSADQIIRSAKKIELDQLGLVSVRSFMDFAAIHPSLYFPAVLVQQKFRGAVMGEKWWDRKKSRYEAVRAKVRKLRDIAELKGITAADPGLLAARFVEAVSERSPLVRQAYSEDANVPNVGGTVLVITIHTEGAVAWAQEKGIEATLEAESVAKVVRNREFRVAVFQSVRRECIRAQVPSDRMPWAVHVVGAPFTIENGLLTEGGENEKQFVLHRENLQKTFEKELHLLRQSARDTVPAANAFFGKLRSSALGRFFATLGKGEKKVSKEPSDPFAPDAELEEQGLHDGIGTAKEAGKMVLRSLLPQPKPTREEAKQALLLSVLSDARDDPAAIAAREEALEEFHVEKALREERHKRQLRLGGWKDADDSTAMGEVGAGALLGGVVAPPEKYDLHNEAEDGEGEGGEGGGGGGGGGGEGGGILDQLEDPPIGVPGLLSAKRSVRRKPI